SHRAGGAKGTAGRPTGRAAEEAGTVQLRAGGPGGQGAGRHAAAAESELAGPVRQRHHGRRRPGAGAFAAPGAPGAAVDLGQSVEREGEGGGSGTLRGGRVLRVTSAWPLSARPQAPMVHFNLSNPAAMSLVRHGFHTLVRMRYCASDLAGMAGAVPDA